MKLNDRLMAAEHDNFYLELVLDDYESRVIPELRDEIFAVESLVDSCDQIMGSPGVYYAPPHVEEAEIVTTPSIETPIMPCLLPGVDPPVPKPIIGNVSTFVHLNQNQNQNHNKNHNHNHNVLAQSENIMKPTMTNRRKHRKPLPDPNPTDHVFELNNCWVKAKVELGVCSASIESALSDVGHEAAAFVQSTAVELSKATNQIVAAVKEDAKTGTLRQVADTSRAVSLIVNKQATAAVIGGALVAAKAFVLVNSTLSTGWEEVIKSFG